MSTLNLIMLRWHDHGCDARGCHACGIRVLRFQAPKKPIVQTGSRLGADQNQHGLSDGLSLKLTIRVGLSTAVSTFVLAPHHTTLESRHSSFAAWITIGPMVKLTRFADLICPDNMPMDHRVLLQPQEAVDAGFFNAYFIAEMKLALSVYAATCLIFLGLLGFLYMIKT